MLLINAIPRDLMLFRNPASLCLVLEFLGVPVMLLTLCLCLSVIGFIDSNKLLSPH